MFDLLSILIFIGVMTCRVLKMMVFAHVILSWLPQLKLAVVREFLDSILGPAYSFVRKYAPRFGMLDLSSIFVFMLIDIVERILIMIQQDLLM